VTHWDRRGLIPGPDESDEDFVLRAESALPKDPVDFSGVEGLFGISPDWVSVVIDNRGLRFWHGGFMEGDRLQLRKKVWGYQREEILSHELAHAGRIAFDEPKYEEILAYQSSRGFRRFFGPIIQRSWEVYLALVACLWWPLGLSVIGLGLLRLCRRQRIFRRLVRKVGLPSVYRLSDREIEYLSPRSLAEIHAYAQQQTGLRWQMIRSRLSE
jgi:hypothetical protein